MNSVLSARDPRWSDPAHSSIVLMVVLESTKDIYGEIPFAASAEDPEPHGIELFNRAVAGEFGEILEPTEQMVLAQVMGLREDYSATATARINEVAATVDMLQDSVSLNMASEEQSNSLPAVQAELSALRLYRVQLAQLDKLEGYPMNFEWPAPPAKPFICVQPPEEQVAISGVSEGASPTS
ncbi:MULTISPECIES: phage tail protein [Pseudomonas syringae group]|uniref:Mu-like prophage, tail fiber assembly domain protein n=1 Tax=Pseudomonas syringae pv. ribicola TaxID=55398 RepID=A0A3M2VS59_PSESI|nr:phage tail protein [Pseudomonas syringae group genomosp. 3]RML42084.1 Mu-like prophage, tail fiber assembly domain protein [Pseudomonas syringae pv. ribicola]